MGDKSPKNVRKASKQKSDKKSSEAAGRASAAQTTTVEPKGKSR
jgi:hypothetical protein